jgi:imidazole glycerol-phosphate synthase subunit HisF
MPPRHSIRIIPRLDIKGANLVKGIHLEGLRVLGKPEHYARQYYEQGADELMYQDVVASLYGRNSLLDIVSRTAQEISIPLTVGGGIRTLDDIRALLRAGADKVAINTAAVARPEFIREAAHAFGSSTIVVAVEAIREGNGTYLAYTDNGREHTGLNAFEWAEQAASLGAGEIIATSVDREGTGSGYDIDLTQGIAARVTVPVVAHGGAGKAGDVVAAVEAGADAICLASILHYKTAESLVKAHIIQESEGNLEFLLQGKSFAKVGRAELSEIREALLSNNIPCRN